MGGSKKDRWLVDIFETAATIITYKLLKVHAAGLSPKFFLLLPFSQ